MSELTRRQLRRPAAPAHTKDFEMITGPIGKKRPTRLYVAGDIAWTEKAIERSGLSELISLPMQRGQASRWNVATQRTDLAEDVAWCARELYKKSA